MSRRPSRSTRTDTLVPYATLSRSHLPLARLQHPAEREEAVEPRRRRVGAGRQLGHEVDDLLQQLLVHLKLQRRAAALHREVHLHVAARAGCRHGAAHGRIEALVALRPAAPHVEAAAVDALRLPGPAHGGIAPVAARPPVSAVDRLSPSLPLLALFLTR